MQMFPTLLATIPKTRHQFVNELELPEITLSPYIWVEPEESITSRSDSVATDSIEDIDAGTLTTASSVALSRAMTDSDIDYDRYRRLRTRSYSDPWLQMRTALDAFPPGYISSLTRYQSSPHLDSLIATERWKGYNEDLRRRMKKFFDEDCTVFSSDDPGLTALEEALLDIDEEYLDSELDTISS